MEEMQRLLHQCDLFYRRTIRTTIRTTYNNAEWSVIVKQCNNNRSTYLSNQQYQYHSFSCYSNRKSQRRPKTIPVSVSSFYPGIIQQYRYLYRHKTSVRSLSMFVNTIARVPSTSTTSNCRPRSSCLFFSSAVVDVAAVAAEDVTTKEIYNRRKNKKMTEISNVPTQTVRQGFQPIQPFKPRKKPFSEKIEELLDPKPKKRPSRRLSMRHLRDRQQEEKAVSVDPLPPPPPIRDTPDNEKSIQSTNSNSNKPRSDNSEVLRTHRLRRNASQFIPMWLRRDPSWKEAVFEHLNLPTSLITGNSNNGTGSTRRNFGESLQGNFYEDTIPSFADVLRNGPPPALYDALDMLVAKGLGDPSTAERYRTTLRMRLQSMEWVVAFNEKKQQIQHHQSLIQTFTKDLQDLNKRLHQLETTAGSTSSETKSSDVSASVETLETNPSDDKAQDVTDTDTHSHGNQEAPFSAIDDDSSSRPIKETIQNAAASQPNDKLRQELIAHVQKIINEKTGYLKLHQYNADSIMKKLNALRKIKREPPMDDDEFQEITKAANEARHSITKVFADHARDLHSQMLERYLILDSKTDLTKPHEWYLHARLDKRKIIYHGGPTNSGKTYQALERLKKAGKGVYLGPLRLLAAEVWERLTAEGIYCNLYTGQELRVVPFATHKSATVEMASLQDEYDVVVIDEIQMINDKDRGFAWTRALLGLRCREIHVCGGLEATDIVKRLVEACGDEFELRTYQRFSELQVEENSLARIPDELGTYKRIQAGDCVVAFSRNDIFAIKREIETNTRHKCCVIYGSLPPSTRSEQARRFNDPDSGYDVLVASDAIGMGLNLNIRRIIFNSVFKNDGQALVRLDHSSVKQISGRAGRRNSPFPNGVVTTRDPRDMDFLRQCLNTNIAPIEKAGLLPTSTHIQTFSEALEQLGMRHGTKALHQILQQFNDIASVKSDYFVCRQDDMVKVAKSIAPFDVTILDKYIVCQCPLSSQKESSGMDVVKRFVSKRAAGQSSGLTKNMIPKPPKSFNDLARLCLIFNELELFLWLQRKFPPGNMIESKTANALRDTTIAYISDGLNHAEELNLTHCYVKRDRGIRESWTQKQSKSNFDDEEDEFSHWNDGLAA